MTVEEYKELYEQFKAANRDLMNVADLIVRFGQQLANRPENCGVIGFTKYPGERAGMITEETAQDAWPTAKQIGAILSRWHDIDVKTEIAFGQLSNDDLKHAPKPRALA